MHCHNCGTYITLAQNFCRTCGANLRLASEPQSATSHTSSEFRRRAQIVGESVLDAFRTGNQFISNRSTTGDALKGSLERYRHWGIVAFWAGLATLLGDFLGFVLILTGLGFMAYARGFFNSGKAPSPDHDYEVYQPPSRQTGFTSDAGSPIRAETARPDYIRANSDQNVS
jgi:hypothetical protein